MTHELVMARWLGTTALKRTAENKTKAQTPHNFHTKNSKPKGVVIRMLRDGAGGD